MNKQNNEQNLEKTELTAKEKADLSELAVRLYKVIFDDLKLTMKQFTEDTGFVRHTVELYLSGKRAMKFNFIKKCFDYLNSKTESQNLNFLYFLDPDCKEKNITKISDLENLNLNSLSIANIKDIKEASNSAKPYLDTLNMFLSNKEFPKFIVNLTDLQNEYNSLKTQKKLDFYQWHQEKHIRNFIDNFLQQFNNNAEEAEFFKQKINPTE